MYIATGCSVCANSSSHPNNDGHCSCGLGERKRSLQVEKEIGRSMMLLAVKIAIIFVPMIFFLSQYHGLGTDILGLKISRAIGFDSPESTTKLADLCVRIERYDCAASSYHQGTQRFRQNLDLWLSWAKMETNRKNIAGAVEAYRGYFANGGTDSLMHYRFAKGLQDTGHADEAITEYQKMIDAEPNILQVTVAQNLVHLLIEQKRVDDAVAAIEKFRKQGDNAKDMLSEEWNQVQQLRGKATIAKGS